MWNDVLMNLFYSHFFVEELSSFSVMLSSDQHLPPHMVAMVCKFPLLKSLEVKSIEKS